MTRLTNVDMKESFDGHLPIAFLDGCRTGWWSDSEMSSPQSMEFSGIVLRSSSRSSSWIDCLLLLELEGIGEGEVWRLLVMI